MSQEQSKRVRKHFANSFGKPKCGRQLSRPGATTTNQSSMQITTNLAEVKCRHCLRALGLLAPLVGRGFASQEEPEDQLEEELEGEE